MKIKSIKAIQILDSRGNPTVAVCVSDGERTACASVPSGASTGSHEALELRDGGKAFRGKGVMKAVEHVNSRIAGALAGMDVDFRAADRKMIELDGTPNKSSLGANAILGVSMAIARLQAVEEGVELFQFLERISGSKASLPVPLLNIINGGVHAGGELKIQEFLIVPSGFKKFSDALRAADETYQVLKDRLRKDHGPASINLGDEGGFAPPFSSSDQALGEIIAAIEEAGYAAGSEIHCAIDAASTEFYQNGTYTLDGRKMSPAELADYYQELASKFRLISVEDPFYEDGFQDFASFTSRVGRHLQVIGDDLYVTSIGRIRKGIEMGATNAALIKLNQVGSVSETIDAVRTAREGKMRNVVSHRSGETIDSFIADMAVGLGTGQIKAGAPARGERVAKYNRLLEIESSHSLPFRGMDAFAALQ